MLRARRCPSEARQNGQADTFPTLPRVSPFMPPPCCAHDITQRHTGERRLPNMSEHVHGQYSAPSWVTLHQPALVYTDKPLFQQCRRAGTFIERHSTGGAAVPVPRGKPTEPVVTDSLAAALARPQIGRRCSRCNRTRLTWLAFLRMPSWAKRGFPSMQEQKTVSSRAAGKPGGRT